MTVYCQHAAKLRLNRPGQPEAVSERPIHQKTREFTDGAAGTQVEIAGDERDLDLDFALRTGAVVPLPCPEHPGDAPRGKAAKGADGG